MNKYVDTYVLHPFVCIITYRSFCLCLAIYVCVLVWFPGGAVVSIECSSIPQFGGSNSTRGKRCMPFITHFVL